MSDNPKKTERKLPVLIVDLDDTLVKTDIFLEQLIRYLKKHPLRVFRVGMQLLKNRAETKAHVAANVTLDAADLPYNQDVLEFLRRRHADGQRIVLATAADTRVAQAVAQHLGLFETVLSSDGGQNLKGPNKTAAIRDYLGDAPFDYIGDSHSDRPIWEAAGRAHVVSTDTQTAKALAGSVPVEHLFERPKRGFTVLRRSLRLHQWAKNFLVFAALLMSHSYADPAKVMLAVTAFLCLGLCASATYIWNDLMDLEEDRRHPSKRHRPLASGALTLREGLMLSLFCMGTGLGLGALVLGSVGVLALLVYVCLTLYYSLRLKKKLAADVVLLAGLYLYRIYLGGLAIDVAISDWLLAFSIFFFLSLGYAKRLTDIPVENRNTMTTIPGRAYLGIDSIVITALGIGSGLCSIIVMALYINDASVAVRYASPKILWVVCLLLLYWLNRIWILAGRGAIHSDPVSFAIRDRVSLICGAFMIASILIAYSFGS